MTLRLDPNRSSRSGQAPPRLADWMLQARAADRQTRRKHSRRSARRVIDQHPDRVRWFWQQTIRLTLRYLFSRSPQERLSYPRSNPMWFELRGDLRRRSACCTRNPGTSALIVATLALAIGAGDDRVCVRRSRAVPRLAGGRRVEGRVGVRVATRTARIRAPRVSAPDLLDYRARTTTLEQMSVMRDGRAPLIRNGQSQTLTVTYATAERVRRDGAARRSSAASFIEGDDRPGAAPVVGARRITTGATRWRAAPMRSAGRCRSAASYLHRRRRAVARHRVRQYRRSRCVAAAALDPRRPARCPEPAASSRGCSDGVTFEQAAAEMASIGDALAREYPLHQRRLDDAARSGPRHHRRRRASGW